MRNERRPASQVNNWPKKGDRKLLYDAATAKRKTVVFSDGRKYALRYRTQDSLAWGKYEAVYVSLADGQIDGPCGWFHIKFLLREG